MNSEKKLNEIKNILMDGCNDVIFTHNRKKSGITVEVANGVFTFQAWNGEKTKEYASVDEALSDKFYDGDSIADIVGSVDIQYS